VHKRQSEPHKVGLPNQQQHVMASVDIGLKRKSLTPLCSFVSFVVKPFFGLFPNRSPHFRSKLFEWK
jgi:hypothetical protein